MNENNLPPTNIEAEETILGGILLDPNAITIVADILPVEAFSVPAHQQIYKAALELHHKDKQVDLMTVSTSNALSR